MKKQNKSNLAQGLVLFLGYSLTLAASMLGVTYLMFKIMNKL